MKSRIILRKISDINLIARRCIYEQYKSGSFDYEKKKNQNISLKDRIDLTTKAFRQNLKWSWERMKKSTGSLYRSDCEFHSFDDNQLIKVWDFNQKNNDKISSLVLKYKENKTDDFKNWTATCDSDYDVGYSKCSWTVSPSGFALFSGHLDTTVPQDGKTTRAGYAYVGSNKSSIISFSGTHYEHILSEFTHFVMRVRGDGRRYFILFDTSDFYDTFWFDRYQFPIFTFGGPYWQYIKIPLTRFFFHYQGFIQDEQSNLNPFEIQNIGILAYNTFSGPFSLEIDYIGFIKDPYHNDMIEYEDYFHETSQLKT
ncbi:mitochondrial inner membrane protease subunit [Sarcoptes scabiei]|nr:mitochondrial inner membrane protease subunit [Sarcoptes scabiei]